MKHSARMPRTAGLRTLTELSTEMTKAGLDPSRIEERAQMIAKVRGVGVVSKRKRDDDDGDMDVDDEVEGGEEWMEVDEDGDDDDATTPVKRRKSNTGTSVTAKHKPRTNRQLDGLRDESVRILTRCLFRCLIIRHVYSKQTRRSSYGISPSENPTGKPRPERATELSEPKWYLSFCYSASHAPLTL